MKSIFPVLLALTGIGVVAWSGCGPGNERYYCDASGCWSCDGYGCNAVKPATPSSCTGTKGCPSGQVCTDKGCAQVCASDAQCAKGTVCLAGQCGAPGSAPAALKECSSRSDCEAGKVCVANKCGGCVAKTDCAANETCSAGVCIVPPAATTCKFSSECEVGKICADGSCLVSCETTPCAAGFNCVKGACQPDGSGAICKGDAECGPGKLCQGGKCVVDTRPKPNCSVDADCNSGSGPARKCVESFCKYTCTTDLQCRQIDARIGWCAKDGVCRTQAEANAECIPGRVPCQDASKSCVDNVCK